MIIEKEILINKNIADVWKVLGHDFAHPYKWASAVNHSEGKGKPLATTQCDERACQTVMGNIREKLTHYSDENYHLSYIVSEGMPAMVKTATNDWKLTKVKEGATHLKIKMEFALQGVMGFVMQPLMKMKLEKLGSEMVEDFAHYAEKGTPHPRKLKLQKK